VNGIVDDNLHLHLHHVLLLYKMKDILTIEKELKFESSTSHHLFLFV
jgi:hypothetical protein